MNDTIASIATSLGVSAISIIRVSGSDAIKIVNKIFTGKDLENVPSHTIHYGHIKYQEEIIDEVLVTVMRAPKTYTMEDVVEINCHGGISATNKVLEILFLNGIREANPGEFTKRAFLNGRIDLVEAEAVMDLINSETEKERKVAINNLQGNSSNLIRELRKSLIDIISNIEVNIDYPEYEDIYEVTMKDLEVKILEVKNSLQKIIKEAEDGKMIKDGITTAIIGRPNVGKSSLLNRLLESEKAIVTDIPGTTRDIVEGTILISGIKLNIIDTAGIRETDDKVEKIGVKKSLEVLDTADLVLLLLNNNEKLTQEDYELLDKVQDKKTIIVVNKNDLATKIDLRELKNDNIIYINTIENNGIDALKEKIKELFNLEKFETSNYNYITNTRQLSKIKECLNIIKDIEIGIQNEIGLDMLEIDLKNIWNTLGSIIGENYDEELLDELFSKFCVGK